MKNLSLLFTCLFTFCYFMLFDNNLVKASNSNHSGCTDPYALNYDKNAVSNDGSCNYLASRTSQNRNAVLEYFAGVKNTFCPDGHRIAKEFSDENPGRVVIVKVHTGAFADPSNGFPDYRTEFGEALANMSDLAGYPAGQMNRYLFPGDQNTPPYYKQKANSLAIGRFGFKAAGNYQLNKSSIVNIGAISVWGNSDRKLTVFVELYYTGSEAIENRVNVALLENDVTGLQIDHGFFDYDYNHTNILRHFLMGQWGELIGKPNTEDRKLLKFEYIVPQNININNSYVAVYVSQEENLIHTGINVPIDPSNIPPQKTVLSFPLNNAENQPLNTILRWEADEYSSHYHLQLSSDHNFSDLIIDEENLYLKSFNLDTNKLDYLTEYFWRVKGTFFDLESEWSETRRFTTGSSTSVKNINNLQTADVQIYPNPVNNELNFNIELLSSQYVSLNLLDVQGRKITGFLNNELLSSGNNELNFNASELMSGLYIIQIVTENNTEYRKLVKN